MSLADPTPLSSPDRERYENLRWWAGLTFGDMLDKAAAVHPDKTALVDEDHRLTYTELRDQADRLALGLLDLGVAPRDRVLLQLPNWHEFLVAYFALQKLGAVPVILIARYRQHEINHLIQCSGATAWIVTDRYRRTDYRPIIAEVRAQNPQMARVVICRGQTEDHGFTRYEDLMAGGALDQAGYRRLAALRPNPHALAHMGPTGGTTGVPKIAPHSHNSYLCKVEYSARASEFNQQTVCLVVLPAAHDLPFANGIMATLYAHGTLVLSNDTSVEGICRTIQAERVNTVIWVPTLAYRMLESPETCAHDLSSLNLVYCGGGVSRPEMVRGIIEKFGCTYLCGYGGTEGMLATTRRHDCLDTLFRSVGKPTCPFDHYKIIDDQGQELPPGQSGHLVVKGPSMFAGYLNMPQENREVFTADGYFRTGDLAAIDASGYIRITGRVKDTIKRGGESIFAPEIEALLSGHPQVAQLAVIGVPDPEMGERVCAVIQPKPGAEPTLDDLVAHLRERGASVLQFPERLILLPEIPLTAAGKVDKTALKNTYAQPPDDDAPTRPVVTTC